ncbi:hypothetical protein LCGC14_0643520 [marine sediment metagenome]|uniref:Uncharacterized protein n=1 Tax=marine sediment metagenome TaxID=412755 RepID=A0A0F9TK52_9ZZZZ
MDAALQNTLLSRKIERMHSEIELEMDRASKAEAEVVRLREVLRNVQWRPSCGRPGTSAYPTCIGCGIVSHGALSTPSHKDDCVIETALRQQIKATEPVQGGVE